MYVMAARPRSGTLHTYDVDVMTAPLITRLVPAGRVVVRTRLKVIHARDVSLA